MLQKLIDNWEAIAAAFGSFALMLWRVERIGRAVKNGVDGVVRPIATEEANLAVERHEKAAHAERP